ncbi:hypothetical protein CQW23_08320 [Capsicum baccatum]|uniref:KIB1-4 beta-propeller domain-containing protein n=1 Tax=Capsicum baccatum TaxID=33114 RepID=A0A2G2X8P3_CAPBA|nr:hypothetical protein CQW23_08320 [Capsicum baccatum]
MTFYRKAVLSASPSRTSDYVLMVIDGGICFLSFWRPGDLRWTRVSWEETNYNLLFDLKSYHSSGSIPTWRQARTIIHVESLGSLFVVSRNGVRFRNAIDDSDMVSLTLNPIEIQDIEEDVSNITYGTTNIRVYQVDLPDGKVTETRDLRGMAFFLGANASLSVQASQYPGIKPNHIYFTDDFFETYTAYIEGGGSDMGVFNLADGSIQPHYNVVSLSRVCPPTWVTPILY